MFCRPPRPHAAVRLCAEGAVQIYENDTKNSPIFRPDCNMLGANITKRLQPQLRRLPVRPLRSVRLCGLRSARHSIVRRSEPGRWHDPAADLSSLSGRRIVRPGCAAEPLRYYECASAINSPNTPMLSQIIWGCLSALSATSSVVSPESTRTPMAAALCAISMSV